MNEVSNAIEEAVRTLKSELNEDSFEFRYSDLATGLEVIDLNCEEDHKELDKIYGIFYHVESKSFAMFFESSLAYQSTFTKEHAAKLIEADIDFDIHEHRLKLRKVDVDLEDLAQNIKLMAEILFNF